MKTIDFSKYDVVFCDSIEALRFANKNGLSSNAIVKTSSPAMLWDKNPQVTNIEEQWNVDEMRKFETTIQKLSEEVYDVAISVHSVAHEEALCIAQFSVHFQRILFKAACLKEEDFIEPRLFLKVDGYGGPGGNNMNAPWDKILASNEYFYSHTYKLKDDHWNVLTTQGVSKFIRLRLAGMETFLYRVISRVHRYIPNRFFSRKVFIPNENELLIETATSLMLRGIKVSKLYPCRNIKIKKDNLSDREAVIDKIMPIIKVRIGQWVVPICEIPCERLFIKGLKEKLDLFDRKTIEWRLALSNEPNGKSAVLINSPGNIKGQSLSMICREKGIPIISTQHGVTTEINALHGEISVGYDSTIADCALLYNYKAAEAEKKSHFTKATPIVVGMSLRHIRMKDIINTRKSLPFPIIYISTNLYKGNLGMFSTWRTDYGRARKEYSLVKEVLSKLPHRVRYKTYPDDNRRYPDTDPIQKVIVNEKNIKIFDSKTDMRYLLSEHRLLITSCATSTLGWPVMTGKPVVFINQKEKSPLTIEAHASLSKGLFVFDDDEDGFYENLRLFLSQSMKEIEKQWLAKKCARDLMIREYFSEYGFKPGAGVRAADEIISHYLN